MRTHVGRDKDSFIKEGKRPKRDAEAITLYLPQADQCTVNVRAMNNLKATSHLLPLFHFLLLSTCVIHQK